MGVKLPGREANHSHLSRAAGRTPPPRAPHRVRLWRTDGQIHLYLYVYCRM